jgi:hypothetical protein
MPTPGGTTARGYGWDHQQLRRRYQPYINSGQAQCAELNCLEPTRAIRAGAPWQLAHDRTNGGYRGPAHPRCNLSEGATYGNRLRSPENAVQPQSINW